VSFIMSVWVREGIVMAADSRLTLNRQDAGDLPAVLNLSVAQSDSNYKLFLSQGDIGIATYGAADISGVPIAGYMDSFLAAQLADPPQSVQETANRLAAHFGAFDPRPATQFHVAGYTTSGDLPSQEVWQVDVSNQQVTRISLPGLQGSAWGGEADILTRLIQPVAALDSNGKVGAPLPQFEIPWAFFTLQDAIDFAVFAIRSTIEAIRFLPRAKTVGGPIDVLVIKPSGASWVQRKQLRVDA